MSAAGSLRVVIDARIVSGVFGGVEQFTIGLVAALSRLTDGDEQYAVVVYRDHKSWIEPFIRGRCRLVFADRAPSPGHAHAVGALPLVRRLRRPWHRLKASRGARAIPVPHSDGTLEALGDVVHFPTQNAVITQLPSLYHPWDLQHRHLPELFSPYERLWREVRYPAFARQARAVLIASEWGRQDLLASYPDLAPKTRVVPVPPVTEFYPRVSVADIDRVRRRFGLHTPFAYYPAKTWRHKNHLALLGALALLRDEGLEIPVVCSGGITGDFAAIKKKMRQFNLDGQIRFLGYLPPVHVECLYRLARCLIYPSRFEGWGLPLMEAFRAGLPVACSAVTCLPEQVGDAALMFAPDDEEAIAATLAQVWEDRDLRAELRRRGYARVTLYNWRSTAKLLRAHYRDVGAGDLTDEDGEHVATATD